MKKIKKFINEIKPFSNTSFLLGVFFLLITVLNAFFKEECPDFFEIGATISGFFGAISTLGFEYKKNYEFNIFQKILKLFFCVSNKLSFGIIIFTFMAFFSPTLQNIILTFEGNNNFFIYSGLSILFFEQFFKKNVDLKIVNEY